MQEMSPIKNGTKGESGWGEGWEKLRDLGRNFRRFGGKLMLKNKSTAQNGRFLAAKGVDRT